jgi:hypothetical protein
MWNSKSWPEGIPKNRVGRNRATVVTTIVKTGRPKRGPPDVAGSAGAAVSGGCLVGTEEIVA